MVGGELDDPHRLKSAQQDQADGLVRRPPFQSPGVIPLLPSRKGRPGCSPAPHQGGTSAPQLDDRVAQCYLLGVLARCAARGRDARRAAGLFRVTENLRVETGATIHAGLAPALTRATAAVREMLGSARFESDVAAGRRLTRDAGARFALRESVAASETTSSKTRDGLLGRRETDVARLVADGLSNREIGARLFTSERTVESHVRNILNKLGFSSRAQIAAWTATDDHHPRRSFQ